MTDTAGGRRRWRIAVASAAAIGLVLTAAFAVPYVVIERERQHVLTLDQAVARADGPRVAVVLGAGIREGTRPTPLLAERLNTAAAAYRAGAIDTILVSGDNRVTDYSEPDVMFEYLVAVGVDPTDIQPDYAGRSTYETCERAHKVFGLQRALLVSEATHLPRAIHLCRAFDVEAEGLVSEGRAARAVTRSQSVREVPARAKAFLNLHVVGEDTVLGDLIPLD